MPVDNKITKRFDLSVDETTQKGHTRGKLTVSGSHGENIIVIEVSKPGTGMGMSEQPGSVTRVSITVGDLEELTELTLRSAGATSGATVQELEELLLQVAGALPPEFTALHEAVRKATGRTR